MAQRFGRAGGGLWSAAGTWSASSGGASDGAGINTGDDVVLDANSTGTFTIDAADSIATLTCTGFVGTLVQNNFTLTVTGLTFLLVAGMTYAPTANTRIVAFTSTAGTTAITTAGKTLGAVTFNGIGGTFQLSDDMNVRSDGTITLTNGTFTANNHNVTAGFFSSNNSNTRVLTMGSGTWTINGVSGAIWDFTTSTNSTINANTSTLAFAGAQQVNSPRIVNFGTSKSYNIVSISNTASNADYIQLSAATAVTIATLNITAPVCIQFVSAITYTITNAFTWAGSAANNIIALLQGSSSIPTIAAASGSTIAWAALGGITFSGVAVSATNSVDLQGNNMNGGSITGPSGGTGSHMIGG